MFRLEGRIERDGLVFDINAVTSVGNKIGVEYVCRSLNVCFALDVEVNETSTKQKLINALIERALKGAVKKYGTTN